MSVFVLVITTASLSNIASKHFYAGVRLVPDMKLVEIVRTITTSDETAELCKKFGESLGKTIVITIVKYQ